ncbi:MAG: hypothetical protein ACKO3R_00300 [bacterium]
MKNFIFHHFLNGLNIYTGVDNQGLSTLEENSKASLLRNMAVSIYCLSFF